VPLGGSPLHCRFLFLCGVSAFWGLLTVWFHGPVVNLVAGNKPAGRGASLRRDIVILRALGSSYLEISDTASGSLLTMNCPRRAHAEAKDKLLAAVSHELALHGALLAALTELEQHLFHWISPRCTIAPNILRKNILP